ncbi:MAG TPA: alpha/beta hydrolase [Pseudonocardia sp.]|jgi:pimeloyl-ACP methyl ester carboxylesterase|nr:alpha/beta hydrolase [Pseudonocardia sp.]
MALTPRTLNAAGHRIHAVEAGSGPLVLMVHGFPESAHSWRHQMTALADAGYHAVAIDQLGYGRSSKPRAVEEKRITRLVDVAAGVVEALGESTATIVGHDWGAPVAWTAAWIRPTVFTSVVGVSVPFGGRGLMGLPGSPFGEVPPSTVERAIAGEGRLFYQEYIHLPGIAEADAERDLRQWLTNIYFSLSASAIPPLPALESQDEIVEFLRGSAACVELGKDWSDYFTTPETLPAWLPQEDLDVYVEDFERSGMTTPFNSYRTSDLDWELLGPYADTPLTVPALFVGGDRDVPTLWGHEALRRFPEVAKDVRGSVILEECGHWVQQEKPEEFNRVLLEFLRGL